MPAGPFPGARSNAPLTTCSPPATWLLAAPPDHYALASFCRRFVDELAGLFLQVLELAGGKKLLKLGADWRARLEEPAPFDADATAQQRMAHKLKCQPGTRSLCATQTDGEPGFGIIKSVMGFRQFLLRGTAKMSGEWRLVWLGSPASKWQISAAAQAWLIMGNLIYRIPTYGTKPLAGARSIERRHAGMRLGRQTPRRSKSA